MMESSLATIDDLELLRAEVARLVKLIEQLKLAVLTERLRRLEDQVANLETKCSRMAVGR